MLQLLENADSLDTITEVIYGHLTATEAVELELSFMNLEDTERVKAIVTYVHTMCENLLVKMN